MIQPQELRIGNYYQSVKWNKPVKLDIFDFEELCHRCDGAALDSEIIAEMFEPIPLTEELLIKCGFKKDKVLDYRWYFEDWLTYDLDDNCIEICYNWEFNKKKYIHQIQNLILDLKGKELTIKL